MNNKQKDLSECEKLIMKIVWDAKQDISTHEIIEIVREQYKRDYARTTVVTFVQRLVEKGFVTTYRNGKSAYVHAVKEEQQYKEKFIRNIGDFWFKGDSSNLLSALYRSKKPSVEELDRVKKLIDELED